MPKKQKRPARFDFKPFSKQQRRLIHWWRPAVRVSQNDFVIADGAIRSGKTIAISMTGRTALPGIPTTPRRCAASRWAISTAGKTPPVRGSASSGRWRTAATRGCSSSTSSCSRTPMSPPPSGWPSMTDTPICSTRGMTATSTGLSCSVCRGITPTRSPRQNGATSISMRAARAI